MAKAECPQCRGTGFRPHTMRLYGVEARVAVPCDCVEGEQAARALERASIPKRYEHCDFENFDTGLYENEPQAATWNRSLEQAKVVVEAFARDFPAGSEAGLLLMGPCGVGKTHLAVSTLKQLTARGHQCLFYDYRELLKEIQASYNPENQSTEMSILQPVLTTEVLLLDDLGASKPSAWALETVGHILNTRYNEKRVTLLTTNYFDEPSSTPPEGMVGPRGKNAPPDSHWARTAPRSSSGQNGALREDALSERISTRIRSRLYEMCRTVEVVAPDFRREARRARA